jgi:hypothetical protein
MPSVTGSTPDLPLFAMILDMYPDQASENREIMAAAPPPCRLTARSRHSPKKIIATCPSPPRKPGRRPKRVRDLHQYGYISVNCQPFLRGDENPRPMRRRRKAIALIRTLL